jgi:serine/threonine-protein kinase
VRESPSPVAVGQVVDGKYRIERVIASGGMGVVVAAQHLRLGTTVALKFLLRHAWENREALSRFLREGQALARITSAHVARVMDVGTLEHGEPYLVMEYLEGADFGVVIKQRGQMPITEAVDYLLQACEAVAEAHANGIVHRDLKPSNLFLTLGADGGPLVKVLDFGISKAVMLRPQSPTDAIEGDATMEPTHDTNTGALVGSPLYMSPEQIRHARRVDERTDIWALGAILYELVCGKPPFEGESLSGVLAAVCADPPVSMSSRRVGVPVELEAVIARCLQKEPEKRYPTIAAFAQALQPFASLEAKAQVARISRLLGAASRRRAGDSSSSGNEERVTTVPSWEGDTKLQTFAQFGRKRLPLLLGAAALVIAVVALVASQRAAEKGSPVPDTSKTTAAAPLTEGPSSRTGAAAAALPTSLATPPASTEASAAPAPSTGVPSAAAADVSAAPSSRRLAGVRAPKRQGASAGASAASRETNEDGTSDRK